MKAYSRLLGAAHKQHKDAELTAAVAKALAAAHESKSWQSMVDMGSSSVDTKAALEREDFAFGPALIQLLNGLDEHRTKTDNKQINRSRRQGLKRFHPKGRKGAHW